MLWYSIVTALAALATPVFPFAVSRLPRTESGLDVQLTAMGNTRLKAVITNKGNQQLNLLKYNTFLDEAPIPKVGIYKDGQPVKFEGMLQRILMSDLPESVFVPLAPGETIEKEFDIASTSDLAMGGAFTVSSEGLIAFAEGNGTTLTGAMAYKTNTLNLDVDGAQAAQVAKAIQPISQRTNIQSDCTGDQARAVRTALQNSARLSQQSAQAARSNSRKVQEYFRRNDQQTVRTVAARFEAVSRESSSTNGGRTKYFCVDHNRGCRPNVLAYTYPSRNEVTSCPSFYQLPPLTNRCHGQDQATTVLHEFTHCPGVYSPFCEDHAYGYANIMRLTPERAIQNADTYSLFANSVHVGSGC
ncbi:ammonium transporter [Emydomyces testavorans]|uniref:Neutral protease 2 n=1 Tax=Emydomyces testavorans TaxID=2070801 RepID=A0AAF0DL69_9EURO|nr:ammonium transporter [Emydomyces testavorans]